MQITANIPGQGLARIEVRDGHIAAIQRLGTEDPDSPYISPGFIDIQVNGYAGTDFCNRNLDAATVLKALPAIWKTGVTTFCPTVITDSHGALLHKFRVLEDARRLDSRLARSAPCYHLEGPYISPGPAHGAHDPGLMRPPDWNEFLELQNAAGGHIGIVTVAPELRGAIDFTRRARAAGVIVAIGHTDAEAEQIHAGAEAGATISTHLGNGLSQNIDRHQNPLWPQISDERLSAGLICDGFHLPRDVVRAILIAKGLDRCLLVTDAVYVAGLDPGRYEPDGSDPVDLLPTGKVVMAGQQILSGSSLSLNRAISVFMEFTGASLGEALRAATTNPARFLQRPDIPSELAEGQRADLILFRGGRGSLEIETVISAGETVL